jgi:hypothetical protein
MRDSLIGQQLLRLASVLALGLMVVGCSDAESNKKASALLVRANEALREGDSNQAIKEIKEALENNPGRSITANAMQLYDQIIAAGGGSSFEHEWSLPPGLTRMQVKQRHYAPISSGDNDLYILIIKIDGAELGLLDNFVVTKHPDRVILDKARGIGIFEEFHDTDDGADHGANVYRVKGRSDQPLEEGLYTFSITMKNGQRLENGWFILSDILSLESPPVSSPALKQVFTTGNPTFTVDNFFSSNFKEQEIRHRYIVMSRPTAQEDDWEIFWYFFKDPPKEREIVLNFSPRSHGLAELPTGRYGFHLVFSEQFKVGNIMMGREGANNVDFQVKL